MSGKTFLALVGILLLAVFLRFWEIKEIPPGLYPDEAMNGNNAVEAMARDGLSVFYPDNNGREGLFMNIQALSIKVFGSTPWALRIVSGIFGVLTVWGIFLLSRKMYHPLASRNKIALFAAFFLATSFWHINFSRIGFRAIMAPFFLVWGLYFFFKFYKDTGSPKSQMISAALGGLFFGLGFHSYIAYRIAPLLLLLPIVSGWNRIRRETCFPCLTLIFILFTAIAVIPLGLYFLDHPQDFFGRTSQISIFSEESPIKALSVNVAKTLGMFWVYGDANWRHNFSGMPQLSWIVGLFFLLGIIFSLKNILKRDHPSEIEKFNSLFLIFWLALMLAPVVISSEGLPHALRAIITIPPVMILSAYGLNNAYEATIRWLKHKRKQLPEHAHQLGRIKRELVLLVALLFVAMAANAYDKYFNQWAGRVETYAAFNTRDWEMAMYLRSLPQDVKKYIVIVGEGIDPRIVTISSQSVLFGTETFLPEARVEKNFHYVTPEELSAEFAKNPKQKAEIVFLGAENREISSSLLKQYKNLKMKIAGPFIVLALTP